MPEKEGIELILEIKQSGSDVKIIAISGGGIGQSGEDLLEFAKSFGADHALNKPIVMKELILLCKDLLGEKN
jgi:CheY-like chemotaxis protein